MRNYFVKTPWWLKKIYSSYLWSIDTNEKVVYLTFDDGPHPEATPFVLNELKKYDAKATFFCIGKNVIAHPDIYKKILDEGHRVGNHTQHHLNGWKTGTHAYLADVSEAAKQIDSPLFRPPYGRIKAAQAKRLLPYKIVMWDVLSGDFDETLSKEKCLEYVTSRSKPGSIIVFHDSRQAFTRLQYALPAALQFFKGSGYGFKAIDLKQAGY